MSKYSKEDNTCRHRIIGNSKKMTCFILLFLHSKKVFDGRCAKCSRCGKWARPSKALTQAQGVLVGMFISLGLGFVIGGSYPFHYFAFVTIPLAIVLNAVRAALLACMQWKDEGDLSDEKRYEEFCREKKTALVEGILIGTWLSLIVIIILNIFIVL